MTNAMSLNTMPTMPRGAVHFGSWALGVARERGGGGPRLYAFHTNASFILPLSTVWTRSPESRRSFQLVSSSKVIATSYQYRYASVSTSRVPVHPLGFALLVTEPEPGPGA